MLRFITLISIIMLSDTFSKENKLPNSKVIFEQSHHIEIGLKAASKLEKNSKFLNQINQEKENLSKVKYDNFKFPKIKEVKVATIDFNKILAAKEKLNSVKTHSELLAFISLGLPEKIILDILKEAKVLRAKVYLRGVKKDLKETIKIVSKLSNKSGGSILINPTIFKRYGIDRVPAYVLTENSVHSSKLQTPITPPFMKAYGDVKINYFLDFIERNGTKSEAIVAKKIRNNKQ